MPYIKGIDRVVLRTLADEAAGTIGSPGEANYFISRFLTRLVRREKEAYGGYNAAIGILECCKLELYRRLVVPYEDQKMEENGDII